MNSAALKMGSGEIMEAEILEFIDRKGKATPFDIVREFDTYPLMEILQVALEMSENGLLQVCRGAKLTYRLA